MDDIELSLLAHGPDFASILRPWLNQIGTKHRINIETSLYEWEAAWPELVKVALYGHGPEISEMGSTWVGSVIAMNVLSPFRASDLTTYGGTAAFLPSVWQAGLQSEPGSIWAIPWLAYTRLIYYRRDLLEKAGIDEHTAFQSHEQLENTLRRLIDSGVSVPWCVPTHHSRDTLHNISSWIWSAGGEFVSADGKHLLFNEKGARTGMRQYFDLYRHLAPIARHKNETDSLYKQGQAAVVMSGPWLWPLGPNRPDVASEVPANVGVAIPLQNAFIGFSYLVVWKHSRKVELAKKLVRELSSPNIIESLFSHTGILSVRLESLDNSPLANELNYQTMVQALKKGRTFPQISLWGLMEEKLSTALDKIWEEVLGEQQPDIDAILSRNLDPLARRLQMTLTQS